MRPWEEAYDVLLDAHRYWAGPGAETADTDTKWFASGGTQEGKPAYDSARQITELAHDHRASLREAEPVWVERDMMVLALAAAATFEPEPLRMTDLLIREGFALLPMPLRVAPFSGHAETVAYRAFHWSHVRPSATTPEAVMVTFYHSRRDADDFDSAGRARNGYQWLAEATIPWVIGEPWRATPFAGLARFVQALWRLMLQTISVKTKERASGPVRSRIERADFPERHVTVITLRRPATRTAESETEVEWTHRWIVGAHWRNQYYSSEKTHRQIWIASHVKGPEDKPLVVRGLRAFELTR